MGSFYTNITVRTDQQARVIDALRAAGRTAFASVPSGGCTVVFDRECEDQDVKVLTQLARSLSARLDCAALAVMNHDDDVIAYVLCERGKILDEYVSNPTYFDDSAESLAPDGGKASLLCRAFGVADRVAKVEAILRIESGSDAGFTFETDRHQEIVSVLGLPAAAVGTGYTYLGEGEFPEGSTAADFVRIG